MGNMWMIKGFSLETLLPIKGLMGNGGRGVIEGLMTPRLLLRSWDDMPLVILSCARGF